MISLTHCTQVSNKQFILHSYHVHRGDTYGPVGPWLVTPDEVSDPQALDLWLEVNGTRRQDGNTRTMIFPVSTIISYLSQCMSLQPGDVIATGTPPGVGMGMKPQVFLRAGDTMRVGVEGLGVQEQRVDRKSTRLNSSHW